MTSPIPSPSLSAPWACAIGTGQMLSVSTGCAIQTDKPGVVVVLMAGHIFGDRPRWSNRTAAFGYTWTPEREAFHTANLIGGVVHPRYSLPPRDIALCIADGYPETRNRLWLPDARTPGYRGKQGTLVGYPQSAQKDRRPDLWRKVVTITADSDSALEFKGDWEPGTSGGPLVVYDAARGRLTVLGLFSQGGSRGRLCRLEPLVPWIREEAAKRGVTI